MSRQKGLLVINCFQSENDRAFFGYFLTRCNKFNKPMKRIEGCEVPWAISSINPGRGALPPPPFRASKLLGSESFTKWKYDTFLSMCFYPFMPRGTRRILLLLIVLQIVKLENNSLAILLVVWAIFTHSSGDFICAVCTLSGKSEGTHIYDIWNSWNYQNLEIRS